MRCGVRPVAGTSRWRRRAQATAATPAGRAAVFQNLADWPNAPKTAEFREQLVGKGTIDAAISVSQSLMMKMVRGTRMRKQKFDLNSETFTLSHAKTNLDRLTEKAMKGEPVYIVRGHERFVLQHVRDLAPIPLRPSGYFANCYTKEEIELDNRLAKASVIRVPKDLE